MTTAIVALHCVPLPLLVAVDEVFAWPLGALSGLSLIFHLRRQRAAANATRLEATAADEWLLHRTIEGGRCDKVELIDQVNLGWCVLLLMKKNRRRFRLVVKTGEQHREQLHRLRVLRVGQRSGERSG